MCIQYWEYNFEQFYDMPDQGEYEAALSDIAGVIGFKESHN